MLNCFVNSVTLAALMLLLNPPPLLATNEDVQHQEAFLGQEEAPNFSGLSPDEAKKKLEEFFQALDTNQDGAVSVAEMENRLREVAHEDRLRTAARRFRVLKESSSSENTKAPLTFEEFERAARSSEESASSSNSSSSRLSTFLDRSRRRWVAADSNGDGGLTVSELADFLLPEESPRMRGVLVQEALKNSDANGDGKLDMAEYLRDLYPDYEQDRRNGSSKLPEWVAKEEAHFREILDLDKSGSLDANEIYRLVVPETADHAKAETRHLFEEADTNGNKFLSRDEMLNNWRTFTGHGVTNFGAFDRQEL